MKNLFVKFMKEEEGSILEYLILIAIVAVIAAFLFPGLRGNIQDWFNDMLNNVTCGIGGGTQAGCNAVNSGNTQNGASMQ